MVKPIEFQVAGNRKPADELADVRERIRALKVREEILRAKMIAGECSLTGDEFKVFISSVKSEVLDTAKIRKELGTKFLKPYLVSRETTFVKLKERDDV